MVFIVQFLVTGLWGGYFVWSGWEKETLHIGLEPALVFLAKLVKFSLALFFVNSARSKIYTSVCLAAISVSFNVSEKPLVLK